MEEGGRECDNSSKSRGKGEDVGERSNLKKILHTRKIMVMHNNKRGECHLRTHIDHKRKRYDNAVDVVVRLHDRPI